MQRNGKLLTRATFFKEVWHYKFVPESNLVDVHMGRLRRKLDGANETPMIRNVRGVGFVLGVAPLSQGSRTSSVERSTARICSRQFAGEERLQPCSAARAISLRFALASWPRFFGVQSSAVSISAIRLFVSTSVRPPKLRSFGRPLLGNWFPSKTGGASDSQNLAL